MKSDTSTPMEGFGSDHQLMARKHREHTLWDLSCNEEESSQFMQRSASWSPRWLTFFRPGRGRSLHYSPTAADFAFEERSFSWDQKSSSNLEKKSYRETWQSIDEKEEQESETTTDPETDSGSEDSPQIASPFNPEEVNFEDLAPQEAKLPLFDDYSSMVRFTEEISLQLSESVTFPAGDEENDDKDESDVSLLKGSNNCSKENNRAAALVAAGREKIFARRIENLMRRKSQAEEENVALLSERDETEDRHICYNVDIVDSKTVSNFQDLTLLELKHTASEGEAAFDPEPSAYFSHETTGPQLVFSGAQNTLVIDPSTFLQHPKQMWSEELRKRLEMQKAYQLRLSYGGRSQKSSTKENSHGDLWTVCEDSLEDDTSTFSDGIMIASYQSLGD